jgi:Ser/Thr protein kinase RdoA (MazF antagonist)
MSVDIAAAIDTALLERLGREVIGGTRAVTFVELLPSTESAVYRAAVGSASVVVRLSSTERRTEGEVTAELGWLRHLARAGAPVARPLRDRPMAVRGPDGGPRWGVAFEWVDGATPPAASLTAGELAEWGALLGCIHHASRELTPADVPRSPWWQTSNFEIDRWFGADPARRADIALILERLRLEPAPLRPVHGDCGWANVVGVRGALVAVDFDDACWAPRAFDVAAALYDLLVDRGFDAISPRSASAAMLQGYRRWSSFDDRDEALLVPCWRALVVERAITDARLGCGDGTAARHLADLLQRGVLPVRLRDLAAT